MSTYIYIIGESETKIWGLSGQERLQRMLRSIKQTILVNSIEEIPATAPVLFLSANYLFDIRVLTALITMQSQMALYSYHEMPVAVRTDSAQARQILKALLDNGTTRAISALPRYDLKDLKIDFQQNLKKKDPPYLLPINQTNRKLLEAELFAGSYKGVTDLVTKWLWPWPAYWSTHFCVRYGIQPNQVTLLSLVFAVLAGIAFWQGYFGTGLAMGWFMTFLDTVDGKLARVTVTSSRLGDILDHGLDIIHPPIWYFAWGIGLATTLNPITHLESLIWLMFIGYVGGRLCEGAFQLWLAPFDIFIWRKLDSFNRLITARRNPNLILLTYGWLTGRPDIGFLLVIIWHLLSTAILSGRLIAGWRTWRHHRPLRSWLQDIDPSQDRNELAVRIFTRAPIESKNQG
ncbi:Phosphatidylglycerophosphate synthase [Nitrosomonas cryotolerans]|uniref:Phosphatidylglycerophosphate synthase n=1 Tax=Nitrosomonas cryotolerans ATCC 49181 TaxID=1131553 RepID=A0A1N6H9Q0_9PROT|nr:CDP-alcohol phosphatidyltransferase family protein [Nitrosomonas cryotolerans]SFP80239.1 Phosphatidylglycerophosphate synthase [Nitrosomonas cryotolerans]SIO16531.1 Phosphatidylglycerophosphate synthase [Nitrosomonas cryotolerans ATCC 49181]